MMPTGRLTKGALLVLLLAACSGDPNDPRTWAKKLGNLRDQKEALDRIANMDVEKARVVVPELLDLYNQSRSAEHLQALARYKDPRTKDVMIEALAYTDEEFDRAVIAAGVLGDLKAADAVDKLIAAAEKPLPIKSRANAAKLAAIRALVKIGDKKAVPALTKLLTTSADEQDFLLNRSAALGLSELRDPAAVPALIKGLFMTGRGTDIFQECRLALVRIGEPSIDPLMELYQDKNPDVREMAKAQQFRDGIVVHKAAYLLGDLRARKAVPLLIAGLGKPRRGDDFNEHATIAISLGQIGTPQAVDALMAIVQNAKAEVGLRASAADALYMSGDKRAVPVLLDLARSGYVTVGGQKASDLRANAAIDLSRLAGPETLPAFKALADKEKEVEGVFGEAMDRLQVAKTCEGNLACFGKTLSDPSPTRAEKAAFAIAFSGDKAGIPMLLGALKPLTALPQDRYPVHQALLFGLTELADKTCKPCQDKLTEQIERDEKAQRIPGARGLLAETRVTLAIIENKEPGGGAGKPEVLADAKPAAVGGKAGKQDKKGKKNAVAGKKGKKR
jgi:HEAT repeat protein